MAAMMGGTMRSPFTALIFTLELTHDLNLLPALLPALLAACIASEMVTVLLLRRSILTEKVARRGHHITREYGVDPFDIHRIGEIMIRDVPTLPASMKASDLLAEMSKPGGRLTRKQGACLVDDKGKLVGIITQSDMLRALEKANGADHNLLEVGCDDLVVIYEDELLREAVIKMLENDIGRLPVVDREDRTKLVGYVARKHLMAARQRWYEEEHVRERMRGFTRFITRQSA
jgi:CBS domain-containing protein